MTSLINATNPSYGGDISRQITTNFSQAASEISALQTQTTSLVTLSATALNDRGSWDALANAGVYPSTGGSDTSGAVQQGNIWTLSTVATSGSLANYPVGSTIRALTNVPGQTVGNWLVTTFLAVANGGLSANIIPRTDVLGNGVSGTSFSTLTGAAAGLTALANHDNEIAVATDKAALVVLRQGTQAPDIYYGGKAYSQLGLAQSVGSVNGSIFLATSAVPNFSSSLVVTSDALISGANIGSDRGNIIALGSNVAAYQSSSLVLGRNVAVTSKNSVTIGISSSGATYPTSQLFNTSLHVVNSQANLNSIYSTRGFVNLSGVTVTTGARELTIDGNAAQNGLLGAALPTFTVVNSLGTPDASMPVGTYYVAISYFNNLGETSLSAISPVTTTGTNGRILITPTTPPAGATGYNIYVGTVNAVSSLYLTLAQTAGTGASSVFLYTTTGTNAGSLSFDTSTNRLIYLNPYGVINASYISITATIVGRGQTTKTQVSRYTRQWDIGIDAVGNPLLLSTAAGYVVGTDLVTTGAAALSFAMAVDTVNFGWGITVTPAAGTTQNILWMAQLEYCVQSAV